MKGRDAIELSYDRKRFNSKKPIHHFLIVQTKSYHDRIQKKAREFENEKGKVYTKSEKVSSEEYIIEIGHAIVAKAMRIRRARDIKKMKPEIINLYNYCAMLYEEIEK